MTRRSAAVLASTVSAAMTGRGGSEPVAQPAPETTTAAPETVTVAPRAPAAPAVDPALAARFLAGVRSYPVPLRGDYRDSELVALGLHLCAERRAGREWSKTTPQDGDHDFLFPQVAVPVDVLDAMSVELEAREHFCLGS